MATSSFAGSASGWERAFQVAAVRADETVALLGLRERWVRCVRRECPDWIPIYDARQLFAVLGEYLAHYNERPYQNRQQRPPGAADAAPAVVGLAVVRIRRRKILSGLINEYSQAA